MAFVNLTASKQQSGFISEWLSPRFQTGGSDYTFTHAHTEPRQSQATPDEDILKREHQRRKNHM